MSIGEGIISLDGFKRYLRPYVEKKIPFLAYWHPQGFGLIRLDEVLTPKKPPCETRYFADSENGPKKKHTLTRGGRRTWEKNMERLQWQCCGEVITVEFDGETIKAEGGFEL